MTTPVAGSGDLEGPMGYTYAAVLVRVVDVPEPRDAVLGALRDLRFSGWVAPPQDGWAVAVPASGDGTVAAGRRGVVEVAEALARALPAATLAVRVLRDRQLLLAAWTGDSEVGRYVSDPSREPGADELVLPDPLGAEDAQAIADACGRPEVGERLQELLEEELDADSQIESERLGRVLRLLDLPTWVVAAAALPRDLPTGPRTREMTRLRDGVPGPIGWVRGRVVEVVRRRRPPPPAVSDPPRADPGMEDPWLY